MKKISYLTRILSIFLVSGTCLCVSACSPSDIFLDEQERNDTARENPRFWNIAVSEADSDNLYRLDYELFSGKPYNDLYRFGDNILLVGEAYYGDMIDTAFADEADMTYEYSFEVYSPWQNRITHVLRHQDITCSSYQVVGDALFLLNDETCELSIYDTSLKLQNTYDISSLYDNCNPVFYATEDPKVFYTCCDSSDSLLEITLTDNSIEISKKDAPYYDTAIGAASSGEGLLAISGVSPDTLGYRLAICDADSLAVCAEYPGCGWFIGDISDNAFIGKTNDVEDYWVYQAQGGDASYFQFTDSQRVFLLPDNSFIMEQEDYVSEAADYIVSYYRYNADGEFLSSFSYSCGDYNSEDVTYLSSNLAYFPEEELCFILAYNINCMPGLLVWDTTVSDSKQPDLTFYSSEEALSIATPSVRYREYEEETGLDYGSVVTLVADPDAYDWDELSEVNKKASELEETYGISIFLGPEVPDMIDCFSVEQCNEVSAIRTALSDLEDVLSCYPENFFQQLCFGENRGTRIYLSGSIASESEGMLEDPSGFVNEINSHMVMVLNTDFSWNWDYTINHELSHMIDRRLAFRQSYVEDAMFSEEAWAALNPDDFAYLNTYDGYMDSEAYKAYPSYFIDSYGTTFATEDRAELFGTAMSDYLNSFKEDSIFENGTPTAEKYRFYCDCIRDGFDTTGWDSTMPWEVNN